MDPSRYTMITHQITDYSNSATGELQSCYLHSNFYCVGIDHITQTNKMKSFYKYKSLLLIFAPFGGFSLVPVQLG